MRYILRVLPYLRPHPFLATATAIVTVCDGLASLLTPGPLKFLFDTVLGSEPLPPLLAMLLGPFAEDRIALLIIFSAAGLGTALIDNGLSVLNAYARTALEQRMALDFRSDMFRHAQRLPLAYHDQSRGGGLIYAINYQADAAAGLVMALPPIAQSFITLIGMIWISYGINAQL